MGTPKKIREFVDRVIEKARELLSPPMVPVPIPVTTPPRPRR